MEPEKPSSPSWDRLFEIANAQEGQFTTSQAATARYSPQLLAKYIRNGRVVRVRRGIYRVVHFPGSEQEDLVALWLWTGSQGVFSHETALALHDLSDVLPARTHVTVPAAWRRRRLRVPPRVALHHADVPDADRTWVGSVPVTSVPRTLADSAAAHLPPDLVRHAAGQALSRGLVTSTDVANIERSVEPQPEDGV